MKMKKMKEQIKKRVAEYMDTFYSHFEGKSMYPIGYPDIEFVDLQNEAGQCGYNCVEHYCNGFIKFNEPNISANFQRYIDYIVGHEVAHWCIATMFGHAKDDDNIGHTGVWEQMMVFLGCEPVEYLNPFHCAPIKGQYQWKCGCSTINFTKFEHEEAVEWGCECQNCGQDYVFVKENV